MDRLSFTTTFISPSLTHASMASPIKGGRRKVTAVYEDACNSLEGLMKVVSAATISGTPIHCWSASIRFGTQVRGGNVVKNRAYIYKFAPANSRKKMIFRSVNEVREWSNKMKEHTPLSLQPWHCQVSSPTSTGSSHQEGDDVGEMEVESIDPVMDTSEYIPDELNDDLLGLVAFDIEPQDGDQPSSPTVMFNSDHTSDGDGDGDGDPAMVSPDPVFIRQYDEISDERFDEIAMELFGTS